SITTGFFPGAQGGSGVVIIRYPSVLTITLSAGLTLGSTTASGTDSITTITGGTGTVTFN
ncbi:hypothetical protein EB001_06155, partial [bacterium]|nr:hypothetical protein [bacterium]